MTLAIPPNARSVHDRACDALAETGRSPGCVCERGFPPERCDRCNNVADFVLGKLTYCAYCYAIDQRR